MIFIFWTLAPFIKGTRPITDKLLLSGKTQTTQKFNELQRRCLKRSPRSGKNRSSPEKNSMKRRARLPKTEGYELSDDMKGHRLGDLPPCPLL